MAYNANTPNAGDKISATQNPIKLNFQALEWVGNGYAIFAEQSSAPTTAANEAGLYAAQGPTSGVSELVFRRESNGTTIPFTEGSLAATGWTRLPSGILLKWGNGQVTGAASITVSHGPAFSAVYSVQLTDWGNVTTDLDRTIRFRNFTLPQTLNCYGSARTTTGPSATPAAFQYLIIGS